MQRARAEKQGRGAAAPPARDPFFRTQPPLAGLVQRLAVEDIPFPDISPGAGVALQRSGDGTTGVYFARLGAQTIVIKIIPQAEAFRMKFADTLVQTTTSMQVPQSRILAPGMAGNLEIRTVIRDFCNGMPADTPERFAARDVAIEATRAPDAAVVIMPYVQQTSMRDIARSTNPASGHHNPAAVNDLTGLLLAPPIVDGFAKIIVADAILGNRDRFIVGATPEDDMPRLRKGANISNVFVTPDQSANVAMDNDTYRAAPAHMAGHADVDHNMQVNSDIARALGNPRVGQEVADAIVLACLMDAGEFNGPRPENFGAAAEATHGPLANSFRVANLRQQLGGMLQSAILRQMRRVTDAAFAQEGALRESYNTAAGVTGVQQPERTIQFNYVMARAAAIRVLSEGSADAVRADKAIRKASEEMRNYFRNREKFDRGETLRQRAAVAAVETAQTVHGAFTKVAGKIGGLLK